MKTSENDMDPPVRLTSTDLDRAVPAAEADSAHDPLTCNEVDCYISTNEFDTSPHPKFDIDEVILDIDRIMTPEDS
ncbi:MAG: hypothetical protein P1U86_06890 [Verrucomicrobiales bacterium]|nr:hypothetical protein [Verrucomicrobiales bacterium]